MFTELTDCPSHIELLRSFYVTVYETEFPDINERESLENMIGYLRAKDQGWYGLNNYHIVLIEDNSVLAGVSISDYFAEPNAGVIEFLLIHPGHRGKGLARQLLDHTEALFHQDAHRAGWPQLDYIVAEMNDPFRTPVADDNIDPWKRAIIWGGWGYGVLDFPYTQPALDEDKTAVKNLLLMCKDLRLRSSAKVPAATVKAAVHDYLRWAMRFEHPETSADYQCMAAFLDARRDVRLLPLRNYVGHSESAPLDIQPVASANQFAIAREIYERAFPPGQSTVVEASEFWKLLQLQAQAGAQARSRYHLWCLRARPDSEASGMASFFSYPWGGFCGYVTMQDALQNPSRRTQLRIRVEEQMLRDSCGGSLWYAECLPEGRENLLFQRSGFYEIAVDYSQLPLQHSRRHGHVEAGGTRLRLYCRPFGRSYSPPLLPWRSFLDHMKDVFQSVYWQTDGKLCEAWRHLAAQAPADLDSPVPLVSQS